MTSIEFVPCCGGCSSDSSLPQPKARFGSGVLRGQPWVEAEGQDNPLGFGDGYGLIPILRFDAIGLDIEDPSGFPATRRLAAQPQRLFRGL
jgi:hypothetical protein